MDTERMQGKVALVTGAASGIGRATALRLAAEGAHVFCSDIQTEACAQTVEAIEAAGNEATALTCDVVRSADCDASVAAVAAAVGQLDALVNVAGIGIYRHATDFTDDEWHRVIAINLSGTFFMCRAAIPHLLATSGSIVNVASAAGLVGTPYGAAYGASKGGVVTLTKSLAVEYGRQGLRSNCVCPGGVDTPLLRTYEVPGGTDAQLMARMQLVPTLGRPEEIAGLIAYLVSDEARYVNGAAVSIDGGQTA